MRTILKNSDTPAPYGSARSTAQRRLIADAVPGKAFTVAELAASVEKIDPAVGLATVYRAVAAMEKSGWLTRVGAVDGTSLYSRCDASSHHHHAVCTACGRVEHTPCPVEAAAESAVPGFRVTSHELTLYGICGECSATTPPSGGAVRVGSGEAS